ncbi:Na(+)-translocating NADH-quinone reductase subunit C [Oceanihabitans sp. 2_MG-2023]|uniref:Na(+)-translocating NADH-quinone reductase subunit C n=1 Tax=Oceanihabitans sp. 2_MG-2023 TaxID=3062661 RepID=UPI0026E1FD69|nr:Na(+)-translocating NADH-quinone reductase subunit C [Oceanihabitans sp. 2_MG-2023]MDO6595281.1 Na(+)-translocating NADH-quinone reductase subunit C [Oceanihabitans sp. 2_MG-2023]
MEKRTDKNSYTILFAIAMVIVVGGLLAFTASALRPRIDNNERLERQQNILYAMGVNENEGNSAIFVSTDKAPELFSQYIKKQLVLEGDKVSENQEAYLIDVKKEQTAAKAGDVRKLPLFVGEKDGQTFYIAPIRGKGLWDAVWAYIAMDENMVVQGAYFDHKGETAGLGANIKQRFFMDDFIGEHLKSNGNFKGINISKSNNDPKNEDKTDNEVDAIAGATITGDGVSAMIKSELKQYVPYFDNLKKN